MEEFWRHVLDEVRGKTRFTDAQIAATVQTVKNMVSPKKDQNKIPTLWAKPKVMPTISDVDFGSVELANPTISSLMASNSYLKRDRLIWHVQNPGKSLHDNQFTQAPLVCTTSEGMTIIDGHHRLAALLLLGATKSQVYNLPLT